jgi:hypothetical protein
MSLWEEPNSSPRGFFGFPVALEINSQGMGPDSSAEDLNSEHQGISHDGLLHSAAAN